jgi:hypothetical protein
MVPFFHFQSPTVLPIVSAEATIQHTNRPKAMMERMKAAQANPRSDARRRAWNP